MEWQNRVLLCALLFVANTSAQSCPQGSFFDSSGECTLCPLGFIQPKSNKPGCVPCPESSFTETVGATSCTPCDSDQVANPRKDGCECKLGYVYKGRETPAEVSCEPCLPGTYFIISRSPFSFRSCVACPVNFFTYERAQLSCQPCPRGQIAPQNSSTCLSCQPDEEVINGQCGRCPAGAAYDSYQGNCKPCETGFFKPVKGNFPCIQCPHFTVSGPGATECFRPCTEGTVQMADGTCGTCPPGSFFAPWNRECQQCYENEYMPYENTRASCYKCGGDSTAVRGATECTCKAALVNNSCNVCV